MTALSSLFEADRTRLKDVEAEILGLERELDLLRMERSTIQERLGTYTYPVLTLPNEIVSEIFLQFLPGYPDCPPMTGLLSPTLLTHICRKWREVALTTPALWRAIPLLPNFHPAHTLKSWLERSCSCPISLKSSHDSKQMAHHVILALPHRLRWEYLKLFVGGRQLRKIEGPTPLLREFDLRLDESSSSPVSLFEAPLLRTAILNYHAAASVVLPWEQLTSLTLECVYPPECTPILLQTCSLVHCTLKLVQDDTNAIQPDVKLPLLESLSLVVDDGAEGSEYLGTFIVPVLRKLQVSEEYIRPDPVTALTSFVSKSGCKLQEVYITGWRSTSEELYRNALPLVSKITFEVQDE
ncbi:hypothetical protein C8R43DRAFT_1127926 [Mycena crocata]|nr:hypothetical protein C8R43DRAFT_1127926 [Mycena crocata]